MAVKKKTPKPDDNLDQMGTLGSTLVQKYGPDVAQRMGGRESGDGSSIDSNDQRHPLPGMSRAPAFGPEPQDSPNNPFLQPNATMPGIVGVGQMGPPAPPTGPPGGLQSMGQGGPGTRAPQAPPTVFSGGQRVSSPADDGQPQISVTRSGRTTKPETPFDPLKRATPETALAHIREIENATGVRVPLEKMNDAVDKGMELHNASIDKQHKQQLANSRLKFLQKQIVEAVDEEAHQKAEDNLDKFISRYGEDATEVETSEEVKKAPLKAEPPGLISRGLDAVGSGISRGVDMVGSGLSQSLLGRQQALGGRAGPAKPPGTAHEDATPPKDGQDEWIKDAREAISQGAPREAVIKRLLEQGYSAEGL